MNGFGDKLQRLRKQRNLSQGDLAAELGIHQTTVSGIERNERLPSLELALTIARFFGIDADELLDKEAINTSRAIARAARGTAVAEVAQ